MRVLSLALCVQVTTGDVAWSAGTIALSARWTHHSGVFDLQTSSQMNGGGTLAASSGTLRIASPVEATVGVPLNLTGTVKIEVSAGVLALYAGGAFAAGVNVALSGGRLEFGGGVFDIGTDVGGGAGEVAVTGAVVAINAVRTSGTVAWLLSAGSVVITSTPHTFSGAVVVSGSGSLGVTAATEFVAGGWTSNGGTIAVAAAVRVSGGSFALTSGTLSVAVGVTLTVAVDGAVGGAALTGSGWLVVDAHTLSLRSTGSTVEPSVTITNGGSLSLEAVDSNTTFAGAVSVTAGASLVARGPTLLRGAVTLFGSLLVAAGDSGSTTTVVVDGSAPTCSLGGTVAVHALQTLALLARCVHSAGTVTVNGKLVSSGGYVWTAGTMDGVGTATFSDILSIQGSVALHIAAVSRTAPALALHPRDSTNDPIVLMFGALVLCGSYLTITLGCAGAHPGRGGLVRW